MGAMESFCGGGARRGGRRSSRTKRVHRSSPNEKDGSSSRVSFVPPESKAPVGGPVVATGPANRPSWSRSCGNDHHPGTFASSSRTRALAHATPFTTPRGRGVESSTVSSVGAFAPGSDAAHPGWSSREELLRRANALRDERGPSAGSGETRTRRPRAAVLDVHALSATAGWCRRWREAPPPHVSERTGRARRATAWGTAGSAAVTDIAPRSIGRVPLTPPRRDERTPRAERCADRRITRDEDTTTKESHARVVMWVTRH